MVVGAIGQFALQVVEGVLKQEPVQIHLQQMVEITVLVRILKHAIHKSVQLLEYGVWLMHDVEVNNYEIILY